MDLCERGQRNALYFARVVILSLHLLTFRCYSFRCDQRDLASDASRKAWRTHALMELVRKRNTSSMRMNYVSDDNVQ